MDQLVQQHKAMRFRGELAYRGVEVHLPQRKEAVCRRVTGGVPTTCLAIALTAVTALKGFDFLRLPMFAAQARGESPDMQ